MADMTGVAFRAAPDEISWLDRFRVWVESRSVPAWLVYLALVPPLLLYTTAGAALSGATFTPGITLVSAAMPVYFLAANHFLADGVRKALRRFRPLLDMDDARVAEFERVLTTLPLRESRRLALLGVLAAAGLTLAGYGFLPDSFFQLINADRLLYAIMSAPIAFAIYAVLFPFLYRTYRALATVVRLHAHATHLDPLRPGPVAAFSEFTLRVAIVLMLVPLLIYAIASDLFAAASSFAFVGIMPFLVTATAIFIVPLLGLHARLEDVRAQKLDEVTLGLERAVDELARKTAALDLADIDPLVKAVGSLTSARDTLLKAQTWPWRPGTFNLFLSLFGGPVLIFVLTRLLGRYL